MYRSLQSTENSQHPNQPSFTLITPLARTGMALAPNSDRLVPRFPPRPDKIASYAHNPRLRQIASARAAPKIEKSLPHHSPKFPVPSTANPNLQFAFSILNLQSPLSNPQSPI